tara:strand:- start:23598 stop:28484 length:4887 start_codon:yes stop_codon:yes gene_type:complete
MAKYVKGLNKDAAPVDQPEGTYRYAKNALSNETAGAISNEPGIRRAASLNTNSVILGTIEITDDRVVMFEVGEDGRSRILLYDGTTEGFSVVLKTTSGNVINGSDFDLKFNKLYPIEGTYKIDPDNNLIIYWTDNFNPPRSLNVTRQLSSNVNKIYDVHPGSSPNKNYIDRLNLFPHAGPVPRIEFNGIASGGALKSGVYYLFLAYTDKDFVQTNYVSYSLAVPIVEDTESTLPIERYDGAPAETQTGKSIVWEVSNLNTDYDFLQPVVVSRIGGVENAYKLNQVDIPTGGVQTVTFSMLEGFEATSVEDTIIDTVSYDTAKTITQLDSVLYLGNLSGSRDIGYQKHANFIKLSTVTHEFTPFDPYEISSDNLMFGYLGDNPFEADKEKGYRGMFNLAGANNRKGYMRDEVYAFYIAFVLNDGTMSYAYHIPGREAYTGITSSDVRKVGNDGTMPGTVDELDFITEDIDSDISTLTQGSGQLFQFYCFGIFGNRDTNFWQNANEFYPNTDDYKVFNGITEVAADNLQTKNVRHHRMPSNASKPFITSNSDDFQPATETQTITYFFAGGAYDNSGANHLNNASNSSLEFNVEQITSELITDFGDGTWDAIIEEFEAIYGNTSTWQYLEPNESHVEGGVNPISGHFAWTYGPGEILQFEGASSGVTLNSVSDTVIDIDQGSGYFPDTPFLVGDGNGNLTTSPGEVNYSFLVWRQTVQAVDASGAIEQTVEALGVKLDDIKIPKEIADKVQGFRIYYAERDHANRRILGQDVIKRVPEIGNKDLGVCGDTEGSSTAAEDFLLSPGVIEHSGAGRTTREATFHDFYLLDGEGTGEAGGQRKSLVPGTHTTHEFDIEFLSFLGPGHDYYDLDDNECQAVDNYSSFHIGRNFNQVLGRSGDTNQFMHFPIREKCKTYLNGDSIYDGRALGFGKRIYNLGGESSILLGYKPNRTPGNNLVFPDAAPGGGAPWHDVVGAGLAISYTAPTVPAKLQIHNFQAYKTDMYLSYDTQELIWTGYEVLGEELENYTLKEDGTPTAGANFTTDDIYGGDTFICRHGYRITHRPEFAGSQPLDHKSLIYTMCESTDNINFRHETDADSSYFPASPVKKMLDQRANVDYTDVDNMHYNRDYSLGVADIKPVIPYPLRDASPTIFETRVQRSAKEDNTSIRDNYRVHLALQFKDLPRDRGSLWKLIALNNLLFLHTEDSLFRTKGKQSMKLSDGSESFVGSGDIFTQDPDEVIQTKFGYGGTQSQWVSLVTKHGYFCLDYRNRRVFMFKDNLYDIGKTGLESWFQDNIPYALEQYGLPSGFDNPIAGIGFTSMYDERYDRILLTKRDLKPTQAFLDLYAAGQEIQEENNFNTTVAWVDELNSFAIRVQVHGGLLNTPIKFDDTEYFTKDGWTVSYDVELNVWVSFHDYIPYTYSRSQDNLMSFSDATLARAIHIHDDEDNRGNFYGTLYPFEFEFIYNLSKDQDKVFYSFNYMIDVSKEGALLHDQGFTSFYVYTTHQISDEQEIEYMINTRRIGNEWKINKFRDLALLQNTAVGPFTGSNFGVPGASVAGTTLTSVETTTTNTMFNIDGMNETINNSFIDATKSWNKQRKFSDKWVGIRLKYSNSKKNLINLYSTNVAAKKFYR